MTQEITLVLAHDEAGAIGAGDGLPWPRIPEDMKRFREATCGRPIIMGRKTIETLGRPLPWRQNIVMTRDPAWRMNETTAVTSVPQAMTATKGAKEVVIIGGAQIYDLFQPMATRLLVTLVHGTYAADVYWTPDLKGWNEASRSTVEKNGDRVCTFLTYTR